MRDCGYRHKFDNKLYAASIHNTCSTWLNAYGEYRISDMARGCEGQSVSSLLDSGRNIIAINDVVSSVSESSNKFWWTSYRNIIRPVLQLVG